MEGKTKITSENALALLVANEKVDVLDMERQVKAHFLFKLCNIFFVGVLRHQNTCRIARHLQHKKDDQKNALDDNEALQEPTNYVSTQ